MKILLTGATGFVGQRLCLDLLSQGHSLMVLSRGGRTSAQAIDARIDGAHWDAQVAPPPAEVFEGVGAVFHLAGESIAALRWTEDRKRKIYESRIMGTRNLLKGLSVLPPEGRPKVLVSASAIGIYGNRGDEVLDESAAPGDGFLARVCQDWEAEAFARAGRDADSIRRVVIRLGVVLGKEGGALAKLVPLFKAGLGGVVGNGKQWMSWIGLHDLSRMLIAASQDTRWVGVFNGVAPQPISNRDFTHQLAKHLHRPAVLPAPEFALKMVMGEAAQMILASTRVLPTRASEHGFSYEQPELSSALARELAL